MYLKVFMLLEIVCGAGTTIVPQFWDHFQLSKSSLEWPVTSTATARTCMGLMAPGLIHFATPWTKPSTSNTPWEMACLHPTAGVVLPPSDNVVMESYDKNLDPAWRVTTTNVTNWVSWNRGRGMTTSHQQTQKSNNNPPRYKNHTHRQRLV